MRTSLPARVAIAVFFCVAAGRVAVAVVFVESDGCVDPEYRELVVA